MTTKVWTCGRCKATFEGDNKIICLSCLKKMLRSGE